MPVIDDARPSDLAAVADLIATAGLPLDGLGTVPADVLVAREAMSIVGTATLEHHGGDGLLRSVAVEMDHRGVGLGTALVAAIEVRATERGLARVFLLTETAAAFFTKRGYQTVGRDDAPEAIMQSVEWKQACGESAIAMMRSSS